MSGTTSGATAPFPPDTRITGAGTREAQITRLYDTVFDRAPDSEGLAFWTAFLNRGGTLDTVADLFVRSPEFQSRGALGNTDFVGLLYRNGLEREPDAPGLGFWTGDLQRTAIDRGGVALAISEANEGVASSLARGTGTAGTGTTQAADASAGAGTGTQTADGPTNADRADVDGPTGADADSADVGGPTGGAGSGVQAADSADVDGPTGGAGSGVQAADSADVDGPTAVATGEQATDGSTGGAGSGAQAADSAGTDDSTGGAATGAQTVSADDTGTGLGDGTSFDFVRIRTPDGELFTVRVVGDDLPVGSEVVDTAAVGDAPDAVVFLDGTEEAASLSSSEWFAV